MQECTESRATWQGMKQLVCQSCTRVVMSLPAILIRHMFPPYDMLIFSQSPQDQASASECSQECSSWLVLLGQELSHFKVYSIIRSKFAIILVVGVMQYSSNKSSLLGSKGWLCE